MATTYKVQVKLDDTTLSALNAQQLQLQVFKGVKSSSSPASAASTVWIAFDTFSSVVDISWQETFGGYIVNKEPITGATVQIGNQKNMDLGTVMTLNPDGTTTLSTNNGVSGAVVISNKQDVGGWFCGMTQSVNGGAPTAICSFPLNGNFSDIMMPYESLVLVFASPQVSTGTVVEETISQSVTVTLSGGTPSAVLAFDINKGWNTNGNPYAVINTSSINLASTLIVPIPVAS